VSGETIQYVATDQNGDIDQHKNRHHPTNQLDSWLALICKPGSSPPNVQASLVYLIPGPAGDGIEKQKVHYV
jgi:hypothetical protein